MSALISTLTSLPYKQFRRNRRFYLWYDGVYAALCGAVLLGLYAAGWPGLTDGLGGWSWMYLGLLPAVLYLQILSHVFVHNATHKSWPRPINRLVGELCGVIVLTRFASWEVVHQRHHVHSDRPEKDPHPVHPNFWVYAWRTIYSVEHQLQEAYYESFGRSKTTERYEKLRAVVSFATGVLLITTWFVLLGWELALFVFMPAAILGGLFIIHFNWSTHNGFSKVHDFRPVNLDHGAYWWGNRLFFGIYFHANHHHRPGLFDPRRLTPSLPVEAP